ncbi:hypothetical protein RND81_13G028500 [Saponaria officinalis]|uniref:Uncharacterized protein n=1 Tax=Saponaria officinalis TaxID=3572 RepID=A0AAW1GZS5_SAPOF
MSDSLCYDIRRLVSQFWCGHKAGQRKTHWISWKKLCNPNNVGGPGFRDYRRFNDALLGKQTWRLGTETESLSYRKLKGKYFLDSTFFYSSRGHNPSFTWRSIWETRTVVLAKGNQMEDWGWAADEDMGRRLDLGYTNWEGDICC